MKHILPPRFWRQSTKNSGKLERQADVLLGLRGEKNILKLKCKNNQNIQINSRKFKQLTDSLLRNRSGDNKQKQKGNKSVSKVSKYQDYLKSKEWLRRRLTYYEKYGKKCAICDSKKDINVHHISYARLGRESDEDLVVLCSLHHELYHAQYGIKRKNLETHQFIEDEKQTREFTELIKNF